MNAFQAEIHGRVRDEMRSPFMATMLAEHTTPRGNITHDWLLMQLSASKVDDIDDAHKDLIRRHVNIYPSVFHDRISVIDWEGTDMSSCYYAINTTGSDLGWTPEITPFFKGKLWDNNLIYLQSHAGIIGGTVAGVMKPSKSMMRWHELIRWAREQLEAVNLYTSLRALGGADLSVKQHIFILFIYHTVRTFQNPANRVDDSKWNWFHATNGYSPVTWEQFAKRLPDRATTSISEMARNFEYVTHVYVWDNIENTIKLARSSTTDPITDAPEYGLASSIYDAKRAIGMPQDTDVFDSSLQSLTVTTGSVPIQEQTEEVTLSPEFSADVLEYTGSVANFIEYVTLEAEATHEYATVSFNEREDLEVGANTISVIVTSQDGQSATEYKVVITRA